MIKIVCESCGGVEVGRVDTDSASAPYALQAALIACHAGEHRSPHRLVPVMETGSPDVEFVIRCVLPECGQPHKEERWSVPLALVGACAIGFHTHHEGHPIEMSIDGRPLLAK